MFFEGYGYHGNSFEQTYRCYPASFIDKPQLECGDKIIMPPSALDRLASLHIDYPMLFELRNTAMERVSHCGVLEFIAEEGMIYMPYWMMQNLLLQEGDTVRVKNATLPKGTYVKLQPHTKDFLDISNPKAILETTLRSFSCLTTGDSIMVAYNNKKYYIDIVETKPASAISIIETDCEVDFAPPLDYKEPERVQPSVPSSKAPAQVQTEELEPEPRFSPFTGVGRRLDGKPLKQQDPAAPYPARNSQSQAANGVKPSTASTSQSSGSRRTSGKLVFGSNANHAAKESQIACERYHMKVDSFCSMIDGKVFHYLINYYVGNEEIQAVYNEGLIKLHDNDYKIDVHGFVLAQSVIAMLGSFPEILSVSDILDQDASYDERSVIILLVFLASELIRRKNLDKLTALRVTRTNYQSPDMNFSAAPLQLSRNAMFNHESQGRSGLKLVSILKEERIYNYHTEDWAATVIQSRFRGFTERNKFLKIKLATSFLQTVTRAWLAAASKSRSNNVNVACSLRQPLSDIYDRYLIFMIKRNSFIKLKKSVLLIQRWVRTWLMQRHENDYVNAVTNLQSYIRGHIGRSRYLLLAQLQKQLASSDELEILEYQSRASIKIQLAWRSFSKRKFHLQKRSAATKIQSHWRGWYTRKKFFHQVTAIINIQACIRCLICQKSLKRCRWAIVEIQRLIRGQVARNRMLGYSYLRSGRPPFVYYSMLNNTRQIKNFELRVVMRSVLTLQRWWRQVLLYKSRTMSTILIQSFIRGFSARKAATKKRDSILTIQRWGKKILFIKSRERSVLTIQSHVRGWITRRSARRDKHNIVVIQSYWKGWLVRKAAKQEVLDLRHRLEKSATNVDDDMRLINRLVAALSELLDCRSISNIRHTCATLNIATEHSQICCETLVAAGAIKILLKQFQFLNRGIPDQEVLKHVLCTLRNIVRYPHLVQLLINTPQSVEIIFQELLRNKCDGFFIACELLRKLCATPEGFESISRLHGHIKRLNNLAQDLERKTELQKRNVRLGAVRDATIRRLKEVVNLLKLIGDDRGRQSHAQLL